MHFYNLCEYLKRSKWKCINNGKTIKVIKTWATAHVKIRQKISIQKQT